MEKNLLVSTLDGTVAFVEVNDVTGAVAQHLDFDVARTFDELLDEHGAVAECRQRLRRRPPEVLLHLVHFADDAHPATAAAERRLEDDRKAVLAAEIDRLFRRRHRTFIRRTKT